MMQEMWRGESLKICNKEENMFKIYSLCFFPFKKTHFKRGVEMIRLI